jgi:CRISPR-associated exonuclease Cas4
MRSIGPCGKQGSTLRKGYVRMVVKQTAQSRNKKKQLELDVDACVNVETGQSINVLKDHGKVMHEVETTHRISGVRFSYYIICKTKLWLFHHNIWLENEHENVHIGRALQETRHKKSRKDLQISEDATIDYVVRGDIVEVHDIKKSSKMEEAHVLQMAFYLWELKRRGVKAIGYLNYPTEQRRHEVILDEALESKLISAMDGIRTIESGPIPQPERKKYCNKCAYCAFCWADSNEV